MVPPQSQSLATTVSVGKKQLLKNLLEKALAIPTLVAEGCCMPRYATEDSAAADIFANIPKEIVLKPGAAILIGTGLRVAIPMGYEIQIRPLSKLALRYQVTVLNAPGTIDSDYRGEISVLLINHGKADFVILPKMKIAQIILKNVSQGDFSTNNDELEEERKNQLIRIPTKAAETAALPTYATVGSAGADISAHLKERCLIPPGAAAWIPTGLQIAPPKGYELQIRPRSGLAAKYQVTVGNAPQTIDSNARDDELTVLLINYGKTPFFVEPGMRIAQLIIAPIVRAQFINGHSKPQDSCNIAPEHFPPAQNSAITIAAEVSPGAILPSYVNDTAACAKLHAFIPNEIVLPAAATTLVPTGLRLTIPSGYELQIRPINSVVSVINAPASVCPNQKGEIGIILINQGASDFRISPGMAIAECAITTQTLARFSVEKSSLDITARAEGGFGHSGLGTYTTRDVKFITQTRRHKEEHGG